DSSWIHRCHPHFAPWPRRAERAVARFARATSGAGKETVPNRGPETECQENARTAENSRGAERPAHRSAPGRALKDPPGRRFARAALRAAIPSRPQGGWPQARQTGLSRPGKRRDLRIGGMGGSMPDLADAVIVGGGLLGTALACELARRSQRVVLLEAQ